ncbi:hypothetical protein CR513_03276, partial [Mucuna pruriens]
MIARTKISVHARMLSMEFGDNLVQFNIFEAMKHPIEDPTLFGIDIIDELVEEHMQQDTDNAKFLKFAGDTDVFDCLGFVTDEVDYDKLWEVHNLFDFEDDIADLDNLVTSPTQVSQLDLKPTNDISPSLPLAKLKSLPSHLKYAYLGNDQQFLNFNGGGSSSNKATIKKAESDHPRSDQEGSNETTCYQDYLSHLGQPMG